tara:strand:+ start:8245 stop:8448 length:204 start_codon:yes stop_codon:yes gene_type:complete
MAVVQGYKFTVPKDKMEEMTNVFEGNRIKKVILGLQKGESDAKLKEYLGDEFPKGTLDMIKRELGLK